MEKRAKAVVPDCNTFGGFVGNSSEWTAWLEWRKRQIVEDEANKIGWLLECQTMGNIRFPSKRVTRCKEYFDSDSEYSF